MPLSPLVGSDAANCPQPGTYTVDPKSNGVFSGRSLFLS